MSSQKLTGKIALVTGSSRGIGRAIAERLCREGASVAINYISNANSAEEIAAEEGVGPLTDRHWAVINYLQEQFKAEVPLTIRKVGKSGVTDIKEFYELFPGGPLKKATKIAGIKKPVGCI